MILIQPFLTKTFINGEWAWVNVDIPDTYTEQFGGKQQGGFIDIVQPIIRRPRFGFENSVLNAALRLEYVDWNKGSFKSTGGNIADHVYSIVPAISWRPTAQTVLRLNYRYNWQRICWVIHLQNWQAFSLDFQPIFKNFIYQFYLFQE